MSREQLPDVVSIHVQKQMLVKRVAISLCDELMGFLIIFKLNLHWIVSNLISKVAASR